jgi:hypothetical protein
MKGHDKLSALFIASLTLFNSFKPFLAFSQYLVYIATQSATQTVGNKLSIEIIPQIVCRQTNLCQELI